METPIQSLIAILKEKTSDANINDVVKQIMEAEIKLLEGYLPFEKKAIMNAYKKGANDFGDLPMHEGADLTYFNENYYGR